MLKRTLLLLIVLFYSPLNAASELPDLGERSETLISKQEEKKLGDRFIKEILLTTEVIDDPIINDYVQKLGQKLVASSFTKRKDFHFLVIKDPSINAFAGPAGYVGINSGAIISTESESELAAIMAHEIAHITQHHIERLLSSAKTTQAIAAAGTLAAILIGATSTNKNAGNIANSATMISLGGATQHMINFTREHEAEADRIGLKILRNAGFNPEAMSKSFERMQRLEPGNPDQPPKTLLTHPTNIERIASAKNLASGRPDKNRDPNSLKFELIRARTKIISMSATLNVAKNLAEQQNNNPALQYAYALALDQNLNFSEAQKTIDKLLIKYPDELLFITLKSDLDLKSGQGSAALHRLKLALDKNKNYRPLAIQYLKTLIATKQYLSARDVIKEKLWLYPKDSTLYFLLAETEAHNNRIPDAYIAKAKAYELRGFYRQAIVLLQQALKIPNLTFNDREIINARIDQLIKTVKELEIK